MNTIKIDLHTHSILSPDGGLSENDYQSLLNKGILDYIAITDHNRIDFAQKMHTLLGDKIIVGEEISTSDGEIIGLFLNKSIDKGLTTFQTIQQIKKQQGLVCIPHPFETMRKGLPEKILKEIIKEVDLMEVFNGRSLQPATRKLALEFIDKYNKVGVANSDAHCRVGIGKTYNSIDKKPLKQTLVSLLKQGNRHEIASPWLAYLCPKVNRFRNVILNVFQNLNLKEMLK